MFGEYLFIFLMIVVAIALAVMIIQIPIMIADARGVNGGTRTAIVVLAWLSILFGFTWIVALVMSLCCVAECDTDNLNKLATAARLYKDKAISKAEYEKLKKKLLDK